MVRATLVLLLLLGVAAWAQPDPSAARVEALTESGNYADAITLASSILASQQKTLGRRAPQVADSEVRLGAIYLETEAYARAQPLFAEALSIREQGGESDAVDEARNYLAAADTGLQDYPSAERLLEASLAAARQRGHGVAEALDNLASVYSEAGRLQDAAKLLREEVQQTAGNAPAQVPAERSLALVQRQMGRDAEAEATCRQALQTAEHTWQPARSEVIDCLDDLAFLYMDLGRYADADRLLVRALDAVLAADGDGAPETAEARNNLAILATDTGDYARAHKLLVEVLQSEQHIFAGDPRQMVRTLDSLGDVALNAGAYPEAESRYLEALKIAPHDPYLEERLASVYAAEHQDEKAAELLSALCLAAPERRAETAHTAVELGDVRMDEKRYGEAAAIYEQAATAFAASNGASHPSTIAARIKQAMALVCDGQAERARPVAAKIQDALQASPADVDTLQNLKTLACLQSELGNPAGARQDALQAEKLDDGILTDVMSFTSERQRLAYRATMDPWSTLASLGDVPALAQSVLRHKGVVLDSLLEDVRAARDASGAQKSQLLELQAARQQVDQASDAATRTRLKQRIETLQADLARAGLPLGQARQALTVTVPQVQAALPAEAMLLEFVRYNRYDGRNHWTPSYGVLLIPHAGAPRWMALGDAATLDRLCGYYRATLHGHGDTVALERLLHALYEKAWAPLAGALPRQLIVSPDGSLNSISMATLLTPDGKFVGEGHDIAYVATGRDLLHSVRPSSNKAMVICADPAFEAPGGTAAGETYLRASQLAGLSFPPLPGTAREGHRLAQEAPHWHWAPQLLTGPQVTRAALNGLRAPHVLHLATHGFFVPDPPGTIAALSADNPMRRSGLALAGAQATLDALARGERVPQSGSGILTAQDVAGLDLQGTWLVTLSACDTGNGDVQAGEGVLGMRRAFVMSGAQNVLLTLWPVSDLTTAPLMADFYARAGGEGDAPRALAETQRDWMQRLRQEDGLWAAVAGAGGFIVSFQGAP